MDHQPSRRLNAAPNHPIAATTRRLIVTGLRLHAVPTERVLNGLLADMEIAFGLEGRWYAVVMFADGRGKTGGAADTSPPPPPDAFHRMVRVAVVLNRDSHHFGHWVIGWSNGWLIGLWRGWRTNDGGAEGEPILIETTIAEPWTRARLWSVEDMAERLEAGYAEGIDRYRQT